MEVISISTVAELLVKIGANSQGLRKEIASAQRQLKRAFGPEAIEGSQTAAGIMAGFAASIGAVGIASVKMAADMEQNRIAFTTMLGSAQDADSFLRDLAKFAEKTPFEFDGLVAGSKRLLAMGYAANEVLPTLTAIGDAVAAVGGGKEILDRVTLAFGQMKAKGSISAEEMKQLAEAGIPAWQILADKIGVSVPEAMKLAENKAIDANGAIAGLMEGLGERFGGMMEKQSQTVTGIFSNIRDKTASIMRDMGEKIVDALDLKTKMQGAATWLDEFATKIKDSEISTALYEMVNPAIRVGILSIAGAVTLALIPALIGMGMAATVALAPLWPLIAVGAILGPIIAEFSYQLGQAKTALENLPLEDVSMQMVDFGNNTEEAAKKLDKFLSGVQEHRNMKTEKWFPETKVTSSISNAAKEFEKLEAAALRVSESIEREWVQSTHTQLEQLDNWKNDQLKALNETAGANENYYRDLDRLMATYDARAKKIHQDEMDRRTDLKRTAEDIMTGYNNRSAGIGVTGIDKQMLDMRTSMENELTAIERRYQDMTTEFSRLDQQAKQSNIQAWQEAGLAFQINAENEVSFTEQAEKEKLAIRQDYAARAAEVDYNRIKLQEEMEKAYNAGHVERYMELFNEENAAKEAQLQGQQAMMDLYNEAMMASQMSSMQMLAEIGQTAFQGLQTAITNILMGAQSAKEAFKNLGKAILGTIAEMIAKQIAGRLMVSLFGKKQQAQETKDSIKSAAQIASSWAKAAAMVSLATQGRNAIPAMAGISATTALAVGLASVPALATGGITTGPTVAMIGEGRYQEAVLPLNRRMFEKMGLTSSGGQSVVATQNNYGDIRVEADYERMNEDFGNLIETALMGV